MDTMVHVYFNCLNGWNISTDEDTEKDEYQLFKIDVRSKTHTGRVTHVTRVNRERLNLIWSVVTENMV